MRVSVLGGEISRRGLLGSLSTPAYTAVGTAVAAAVVLWFSVGDMAGALSGFAVLGGTYALVKPWGRRSIASRVLWRWRWRRRRVRGETMFIAPAVASTEDPEDLLGPLWALPTPLGRVEPLDLCGTAWEHMFVLWHHNPGERPYLSVLMEVQGQASGLRTDFAYEVMSIRYGVLLAQLAKAGSHIRGLQQINRCVPHDPVPHRQFIAQRVSSRAGLDALIESYEELVDQTARTAEQHRNFLVARFPLTTEFFEEARSFGDGPGGWAALVREELARLADLAVRAELARPQMLGEQRTCAVLRSLQDPRWPIDQHQGARWATCWQSYQTEPDRLVVNDLWHTRTAFLPRDAIAPAPLGPRWLAPLLTGVSPSVIRTVSVRLEFIVDRVARAKARQDVAHDGASLIDDAEKRRVDDGTDTVMLSASQRRLRDLAPGSGHHGVDWAMAVSVTATDPAELRRACMRVANAAAQSALTTLDWQDRDHDAAVMATYPLARGMAVT